ncbi:MAG: ADYC domain-containing protein [Polyangia bacterium]
MPRAEVIPNALSLNALSLNALSLNALSLNALSLNALSLNALSLNSLSLNSLSLNSVEIASANFRGQTLSLSGSQLSVSDGRRKLSGTQLIGALLHYDMLDKNGSKTAITLRIEDVRLDPTAKSQDVWLYRVVARPDATPTAPWTTLCTDEKGNPDNAIPLAGVWDSKTGEHLDDPNGYTWGCRDFPLGKCTALGYRPWAKETQCTVTNRGLSCGEVSLRDHHQACTRMMRADYCGNGTPYTTNGTKIDLYDYLLPPINVPETDWDIEARWTPQGALCLSEPRHPELLIRWRWPDCDGDGKIDAFKSCRDDPTLRNRGLLVTRVQEVKPPRN